MPQGRKEERTNRLVAESLLDSGNALFNLVLAFALLSFDRSLCDHVCDPTAWPLPELFHDLGILCMLPDGEEDRLVHCSANALSTCHKVVQAMDRHRRSGRPLYRGENHRP